MTSSEETITYWNRYPPHLCKLEKLATRGEDVKLFSVCKSGNSLVPPFEITLFRKMHYLFFGFVLGRQCEGELTLFLAE